MATDDLDDLLASLSSTPLEVAQGETDDSAEVVLSLGDEVRPEPGAPAPPRPPPKRRPGGSLTPPAPGPKLEPGAGPEAKIEYFREKLKLAEAQVARLKKARAVRDRELDAIVSELASERQKSSGLAKKLRALEAFMVEKKAEFEAYGHRVAAGFAHQEKVEKALRSRLQEVQRLYAAAGSRAESDAEDSEKLAAALSALNDVVDQRANEADTLRNELAERESETERLMMALRAERAQREKLADQESEADRLMMALRAERGQTQALRQKVDDLESETGRLRVALESEHSKLQSLVAAVKQSRLVR